MNSLLVRSFAVLFICITSAGVQMGSASAADMSSHDQSSYLVDSGPVMLLKTAPTKASLKETFSYTLTVTALSAIANVVVNDMVPAGASYVKSEPAAQVSGSKLSWSFPQLAADAEKTITVWLRADRQGDLSGCATITAEPVCCVTTLVGKAQLSITKSGPDRVTHGEEVVYDVTVTNTGTAVARKVVLTDNIPSGLSHDTGQSVITEAVGDLAPDESYDLTVYVTANERGRFCNKATASSDNTESVSAEACTVVVKPSIQVTKVGPKTQYLKKNAKYTIQVTNTGDVALTNVVVTDQAPYKTTIVTAQDGYTDGGSATWTVDKIKPSESKKFTVTLTATEAGEYCNEVRVTTDQGLAGESTVCTIWKGYPALLLEVVDTVDPLQVGEETNYQIRITNQGTASDTNVRVIARFPKEVAPTLATGSTQARVEGGIVTFSDYPVLEPKETIEFSIEAAAKSIGDSRLIVEMYSDLLGKPVKEEESTHVY